MDRQYVWKKTEDREVDLVDLLGRLCGKWKQMAACALIFAFILGGYGWIKGRGGLDTAAPVVAEKVELTEEEGRAVASAVQLKKEMDGLEEYLDHSILMRVDPYHKDKFIMLYSIDGAKRQELAKITESYLNYISNGGAADALRKSGSSAYKMDKSYLAEVMSAYQKTYSSPYQVVVEDTADADMRSEILFYVEVIGEDAEAAGQMAKDLQSELERYALEVAGAVGNHKLALVSTAQSVTVDSGLQSQQHDKKALLTSNKASLQSMTDAFNEGQKAVYKKEAGIQEGEDGLGEGIDSLGTSSIMKYTVLGLAGGIFLYGCIFVCLYLFRDTVKSVEEMKRIYLFPFYGGIHLNGKGCKKGVRGQGAYQDIYSRTKAQVMNRIRLACKKQGVVQLYAVSDFEYDEQEKACLESIAGHLEGGGIAMVVAQNAYQDMAVWDKLEETGIVLMVCRMGTTTHRIIDDAMGFYLENGITVLGAIAFS